MQITQMKMNQINLGNQDNSASTIQVTTDHPVLTGEVAVNYQKVLSYSKLKLHEQISHRNVKIYENQYIHQIFTKNDPKLPHLVFLHGYGGTSMTAIRMFEHMHNYFQVHALDTYGFGYSSRGRFSEEFTFEQVRDYYINALQQWRKALKIQKFYLVGHSFGGYISTFYAATYPERVEHLFLVSPAGASQRRNFGQGQMTCRQKMFVSLGSKIYGWNIRPSRAMTNFLIGNKLVNSILINRLKIPQDQQEDWRQYFRNVNSQSQSSEVGFYKMFEWPLKPVIPIQQMIRKNMLPMGIDFYFGDNDWMPRDGAQKIVEQKFKNIHFTTIPNAGHQIVFDNSAYLCECIIRRVKELTKNEKN